MPALGISLAYTVWVYTHTVNITLYIYPLFTQFVAPNNTELHLQEHWVIVCSLTPLPRNEPTPRD